MKINYIGISCLGFGSILFVYFFFVRKSIETTNSCVCLPVSFFPFKDTPIIQIEIEGIWFRVIVDTGSSHYLDLKKENIENIKNKIYIGNSKYFDLNGYEYDISSFEIPFLKFRNGVTVKNIEVYEESEDFLNKDRKKDDVSIVDRFKRFVGSLYQQGRVGWTLFTKSVCFFDFQNSRLFLCKDIGSIPFESSGCLGKFLKIPFQMRNIGIVIPVKMDNNTKNMLLDSGSTASLWKDKTSLKELEINGHSFGTWNFQFYPIDPNLTEIDGILGIDFFKKYRICIDFLNRELYIELPDSL